MNVSLLPENIINYIPLINKVLPSHSQIPILSNVLLEATGEGFFVSATDLDFGVKIKIPAKIEEEGAVTVPGREFLDSISNLPKDKIVIHKEKELLKLSGGDSKLSFDTIDKGEFPQLYKNKGTRAAKLKRGDFIDIFSGITFSISQDESRPQLTGVFVDPKRGWVNFVTTDGYRMTVKRDKGAVIQREGGLIVGIKTVNEALSLKGEDDVVFFVNDKESQVIFEIGEAILVGRMLEGKFPDYEGVLPKKSSTEVVFDREALLQNVRLISVFARNNSNIARLEVGGGSINLSTKSQGVGDGTASLECSQKGEDVSISFNIKYLADVLKAGKEKDLTLRLNSPSDPAVFENKSGDFLHVIMPIQVDS